MRISISNLVLRPKPPAACDGTEAEAGPPVLAGLAPSPNALDGSTDGGG